MKPPQLLPPFAELLVKEDYGTYQQLLAAKGIDWWLDFQFPRIALHLTPLAHTISGDGTPPPTRLQFLTVCFSPCPSLQELDLIFHTLLIEKDHDAASACVALALNTILESGREFSRSVLWNRRAEQLWKSSTLSSLAHGALLIHFCFAEIAGGGDISLVYSYLPMILSLAEESRASSLFLMYSALGAYIHCWKADFAAFEIVLDDSSPYLEAEDASPVAVMQHMTSRGLFTLLKGNPKEGQAIFSTMLAAPNLEQMPSSMWLQLHGHYLYCLVSTADLQGVTEIAEIIRNRAIPENNQYFHAYLHFNLGIASLAQSRPHKALLHSEEALRLGALCDSANAVRMSALLYGQALADLGRHDDALSHLSTWLPKWRSVEYYFIASLACVEMSWIYLRQGDVGRAQSCLCEGYRILPEKEKILSIYRPTDYVSRLEEALLSRSAGMQESAKPIRITTLGDFFVTVEGSVVGKARWKGRQSKKLLQTIISLGGQDISMTHLADIFWPDSDGDRAANALKVALNRLRKVVVSKGSGYSWLIVKQNRLTLSRDVCDVDAYFFEEAVNNASAEDTEAAALKHALSLYTGNYLEAEEDQWWHIRKRDELRDIHSRATIRLLTCYRDGNASQADSLHLERALRFDPLNSEILTLAGKNAQ